MWIVHTFLFQIYLEDAECYISMYILPHFYFNLKMESTKQCIKSNYFSYYFCIGYCNIFIVSDVIVTFKLLFLSTF